jgi:hypothetical protein
MVGPGDEERQRPDDADISVVSPTPSRACGVEDEVVVLDDSFNVPSNLLELHTDVCSATCS